ncbi:MAG: hypothetical protein ACJ745_22770, partial [Actinomycetes bacterium]
MRKGLTFEAAQHVHRRRGRSLIVASVAVCIVGLALSSAGASVWGADRRAAAQARFDDTFAAERGNVTEVVERYHRMLIVAQGFFSIRRPTEQGFQRFAGSFDLPRAYPAVIALQFVER